MAVLRLLSEVVNLNISGFFCSYLELGVLTRFAFFEIICLILYPFESDSYAGFIRILICVANQRGRFLKYLLQRNSWLLNEF